MTATLRYSDDGLVTQGLSRAQLPRHIAVIMDGNGRWAQSQGLPRVEGHRRGVKSVRNIVEECARLGIEQLTLYCLSSENWKRPRKELDFLMSLLEQYVIEERSDIMRQDLTFAMIGRRDGLSQGVLREVQKTVDCSRQNQGMRLCLAVNYGSRAEILDAVRALAREAASGRLVPEEISEDEISRHLYTAGMPDPDLLIRTAGEMRVSNFLLWQISYAELWVTEKCWPEFRTPDLFEALRDFAARDRRFGGLNG
ncbi:MAG: isoprenyl transferase [Planctomycetaceae bacterium]|nr:isoprenyl transferase [Planctomycetaceae bacterium]